MGVSFLSKSHSYKSSGYNKVRLRLDITCVVLYVSGIGTVTGFAITLGIGVVVSMFTAIVVTKLLLRQLAGMGISKRSLFYREVKTTGGAE